MSCQRRLRRRRNAWQRSPSCVPISLIMPRPARPMLPIARPVIPEKFREEHEQEILLHQAAKNAFDEMGVKKLPKVKDLQSEYAKLLEEKKKTYAEYRRSREEMRELLTAKANVDRLLKMDEEQKKEQEKDHGQR